MSESAEIGKLKRLFTAALNHEIRTPLSGILGMTSLLEQSNLSPDQREYVNLTKACAEELYSVLSSALEFTALESGDTAIAHSDFLLEEAIQAIAARWLIRARKKGLQFHLRLTDDLPETAKGDEIRLRKILDHLLSNAVKFTETGSIELEIDTELDADNPKRFWFVARIHDTGIGMDAGQIARIFESFEQLDSGLGRRYPGLGLGLTLAQGLARILGGDLSVTSEPGSGSCFTIRLPLETSKLESSFVLPSTKRILVVDDNDAARKVAEAYLRRAGYAVDLAVSGEHALELIAKSRYDLIVMDLQMPGMDGIETTVQLRGIHGYENTPVLAFTANSGDEYRRLCLSHGMQGYLPKPIDSDTLLQTVRRLL